MIFFKRIQLGAHYFLVYLFHLVCMFRAPMCPSSGELIVSVRHWYFSPVWVPVWCALLLGIFISTSVHVSDNCVPIIRRNYCICATLVFFNLYGWLSGVHYFLVYLFQLLYMFRTTVCPSSGELTVSVRHCYFSLCVDGCLVCCSRYSKFS